MFWRKPSHEKTPSEGVTTNTNLCGASEDIYKAKVGLLKLESDGGIVHLLHLPRLAINGQHRAFGRRQLIILMDVLIPEHEIIGGEGMTIGPLHALTQEHGKGAAIVGDVPAFGDIGGDFIAGIVPEQDFVMPATAIAVPVIGRTAEATAPRAAVFADLVHRLDHQWVLTHPFLYGWQLPCLDRCRQLWRLLKTLGK